MNKKSPPKIPVDRRQWRGGNVPFFYTFGTQLGLRNPSLGCASACIWWPGGIGPETLRLWI